MSFGRNPHVARAEAAELKAQEANDALARKQGWLEAARQWDRAAEREKDAKRKQVHLARAELARTQSEHAIEPEVQESVTDPAPTEERANEATHASATSRRWLN